MDPTSSLAFIATLPPQMKDLIHSIHLCEKPFNRSVRNRKFHLTLSQAFSKSILKITPLWFLRCNSWTVSCKITTSSKMFRPRIKAICEGLVMLSATELIWIVATFVNILKLTFKRQIGLYCWILLASCVFGNNIMTPKFRLKRGRSPLCRSWNICMRSPLMTSQNCW